MTIPISPMRVMRIIERYFSKYPFDSSLTTLIESKIYFKYSIECAKKKLYYKILNNSNNIRKLYYITIHS